MKGYHMELVIAERQDFTHGKAYLREILFFMIESFLEAGGTIKKCPTVFASGCEIPSSVRQAIRSGC